MKKYSLYLSLLLAFVLGMTACGSDNSTNAGAGGYGSVVYGQMTDPYAQVYRTVKLGNKVWMTRNYNVDGSSEENGTNYSRKVFLDVCPEGWHVSTLEDWKDLRNFIESQGGGPEDLAAKGYESEFLGSGIWSSKKAKDTYGFSMVPAGYDRVYYRTVESLFITDCLGASFWIGPGEAYSEMRFTYKLDGLRFKNLIVFSFSDSWWIESTVPDSYSDDVTARIRCVQD